MIKLDIKETILAYIGFVLPIFLHKPTHEVAMIAFYIFGWCITVYVWNVFLKP